MRRNSRGRVVSYQLVNHQDGLGPNDNHSRGTKWTHHEHEGSVHVLLLASNETTISSAVYRAFNLFR